MKLAAAFSLLFQLVSLSTLILAGGYMSTRGLQTRRIVQNTSFDHDMVDLGWGLGFDLADPRFCSAHFTTHPTEFDSTRLPATIDIPALDLPASSPPATLIANGSLRPQFPRLRSRSIQLVIHALTPDFTQDLQTFKAVLNIQVDKGVTDDDRRSFVGSPTILHSFCMKLDSDCNNDGTTLAPKNARCRILSCLRVYPCG